MPKRKHKTIIFSGSTYDEANSKFDEWAIYMNDNAVFFELHSKMARTVATKEV
jgi:hypothetical protein